MQSESPTKSETKRGSPREPSPLVSGFNALRSYSIGQQGLGILLLVSTAVLFVVSGHLTQEINYPYFVTYFNTSFCSVYLIVYWLQSKYWRRDSHVDAVSGNDLEGSHVSAKSEKLSPRETAKLGLMFFPIWATMNLLFNWSLSRTSLASNTIISSSSSLFTLGFSWLILRSPIRVLNAVGAAITVFGAVVVCTADSLHDESVDTDSLLGNTTALISAMMSGFYTNWLKKKVPNDDAIDMSLFLGALGVGNMVIMFPLVQCLHSFNVEDFLLMNAWDASLILLNAFVTIVSNYTWGRGIVLTTPLIGVVGLSLTTPIALLDDVFISGRHFSALYYFGAFAIVIGFLITNWQYYQDDQLGSTNKALSFQESSDENRVILTA